MLLIFFTAAFGILSIAQTWAEQKVGPSIKTGSVMDYVSGQTDMGSVKVTEQAAETIIHVVPFFRIILIAACIGCIVLTGYAAYAKIAKEGEKESK